MNTNSYNEALEYDFDMFEQHTRVSSAAAPKRKTGETAPAVKPNLRLVENKKRQSGRRDDKHTGLRSAVIVVFAVLVLAVIGLQINAGARSYELSRQIEIVEKKISEAETENIRLTNELNSVTTIGNIDNYARNVLGMVKCESYQVKCIDLSDGDKVIYSGSESGILDLFD